MAWIKIFISHSTKGDKEAHAFVNAVKAALDANEFDVLVDDDLQSGDNWRDKLYHWMDEAHGAALLLTKKALESEFVAIEASVFAWRSRRQPEFALVPVLLGVTLNELKSGVIGQLDLPGIQLLTDAKPADVAAEITSYLAELKKRLARPWTPREKLVRDIAGLLRQHFSWDYLQQAGANPKAAFWTYGNAPGQNEISERFAQKLCALEFKEMCNVVLLLGDTRERAASALDVLYHLGPLAVPEPTARPLCRVALRTAGAERSAILPTQSKWLPEAHISRSYFRPIGHGFRVCETVPAAIDGEGSPALAKAVDVIERAILNAFKGSPGWGDKVLRKQWEQNEADTKPTFVLFRWKVDRPLLDELHRRLPTLTFLVLLSEEEESGRAHLNALRDQGVTLLPSLPEETALDTEAAYYDAAYELDRISMR